MKVSFLVGNNEESCGHRHENLFLALECLSRSRHPGNPLRVYRITYKKSPSKKLPKRLALWHRSVEIVVSDPPNF